METNYARLFKLERRVDVFAVRSGITVWMNEEGMDSVGWGGVVEYEMGWRRNKSFANNSLSLLPALACGGGVVSMQVRPSPWSRQSAP